MVIIAPSILGARWTHLAEEVRTVVQAGADWLHLDVMDGHFVPPISFGMAMVEAVRSLTTIPLDVHLMVERPERFVVEAVRAGAQRVTVHAEACVHLHRTIAMIREAGASPGVAVNPATPIEVLSAIIDDIDLLLVMTVNPGFGGQAFIPNMLSKVRTARQWIDRIVREQEHAMHQDIQVDGGIDERSAPLAVQAGATVLVAGSAIFGAKDRGQAIQTLRQVVAKREAHSPEK